jgi:hypothetical protein
MKSKQSKDQAAMINAEKRKNMTFRETSEQSIKPRPFVNAGAPSHGVMEGPDRKNANNEHVSEEETAGYGYKGYNPKAWKY